MFHIAADFFFFCSHRVRVGSFSIRLTDEKLSIMLNVLFIELNVQSVIYYDCHFREPSDGEWPCTSGSSHLGLASILLLAVAIMSYTL